MSESNIKPMNPAAMNYLGWFMADSQSLRNWATQLFGGDIDLNDPKTAEIVEANELMLSELEDDIAKIREFVSAYVSLT